MADCQARRYTRRMLSPLSRINFSNAGQLLRRAWRLLSPLPGGKHLFSGVLGLINPYTGAMGARFLVLEPGYARVQLRERRAVRNHLNSIHAVALINLAEVTSGLSLLMGLPPQMRGIPVHLSIDYHKKSRGVITCECRCDPPADGQRREFDLLCSLRDESDQLVAEAQARWIIGPKRG